MQISPGMTHLPSRLCLSDLRRSVPYKFWALMISDISPRYAASYPLSVRQASALPSASFRFTVARDTLAVRLTHRGKPPALPGDSPRFDLYEGRRELLISAKRKEIHDERVPEPEPYEMGLLTCPL